jgi:NAD(P)-dependent dehydrogenase (short-subunit alcohol dehydrogenase family)
MDRAERMMLSGKTIALTGAGKGIGRACADFFVAQGARVVALTRSADDVAALHRDFANRPLVALQGDVTLRRDFDSLLALGIQHFGRVDGLVNNAGIRQRKDFMSLTTDDFNRVLSNNLISCFEGMQVFVPHMKEHGGGAVVNVASVVGLRGFAQLAGYAAAKAGLIGLSRAVAVELAPLHIRVNVVAPGFVTTSYADAFQSNLPDLHQWTLARTPLNRWGTPEEIAACIAFLLSDFSTYVTGALYPVDGGWTAA